MLGGLAAVALAGVAGLAGVRAATASANGNRPRVMMFKDPNCGCCGKWADAAEAAGFSVETVSAPDMASVKARLGVPAAVSSCHTSVVDRYVVEGHVPLDAVRSMLRARPDIRGIAVGGMPIGSPGMEIPGQPAEKFTVMAFTAEGKVSAFKP